MSGLFASWLWCGARPTGDGVAPLGDEPDDNACASHQLMIRTNIVDQVQLPATLEPGAYMLSWRWVRLLLCLSVLLVPRMDGSALRALAVLRRTVSRQTRSGKTAAIVTVV